MSGVARSRIRRYVMAGNALDQGFGKIPVSREFRTDFGMVKAKQFLLDCKVLRPGIRDFIFNCCAQLGFFCVQHKFADIK